VAGARAAPGQSATSIRRRAVDETVPAVRRRFREKARLVVERARQQPAAPHAAVVVVETSFDSTTSPSR
jgi:hypothetical protein